MSNDSIPDWETPATRADLRWWWPYARRLRWTWAVTYENTAPHWWIRVGRTPGFTQEDCLRVGRVIRTFGEPGKFFAATNVYLFNTERTHKVWCQWPDPVRADNIRLVNLAHTDRTYGEQASFDEQRLAALRLGR